jgi:hypothetical protein
VCADNDIKINVCAHGRLVVRYGRPAVPYNAVAGLVCDSDSSSAPFKVFGDLNLGGTLETPHESDDSLDKEEEV